MFLNQLEYRFPTEESCIDYFNDVCLKGHLGYVSNVAILNITGSTVSMPTNASIVTIGFLDIKFERNGERRVIIRL